MKKLYWFIYFISFSNLVNAASSDNAGWEQISVQQEMQVTLPDGSERTIHPSCAFDTLQDNNGNPVSNQFKFFFKPGPQTHKVLVYFNGGGACWNDATCVSSLVTYVNGRPTYNPSINDENSPINAGGIFKEDDRNPFKGWSKIYIPYCTGDLHIGSNTALYQDLGGLLTGSSNSIIPVKHHGFDNFLAVRQWLIEHYSNDIRTPNSLKKLVLTGSSAGGYGATFNFPYLAQSFPNSDAALISDASAFVVTQGFLDHEFNNNGNWHVLDTINTDTFMMPDANPNSPNRYHAEGTPNGSQLPINTALLSALTETFPDAHFSQDTTLFDAVQVLFFKVMTKIDEGSTDPSEWSLNSSPEDFANYFVPWHERMKTSFHDLSFARNYQYYIGDDYYLDDTFHTYLTDTFKPGAFYNGRVGAYHYYSWVRNLLIFDFLTIDLFNALNLETETSHLLRLTLLLNSNILLNVTLF